MTTAHDGRRAAILAIDTATTRIVIATGSPSGIADGISTWSAGYRHGETLLPSISRFLGEQNIRRSRLTGIVVGTGPGAFTGVRVGLAAVKGLAEALGKPAAGISNLRALASFGSLHPVIDARRGEVYTAMYGADLRLVSPEMVGPFTDLPITPAPENLAAGVALCAEMDGPAGWQNPAALDANYVRRADAELFWKDS